MLDQHRSRRVKLPHKTQSIGKGLPQTYRARPDRTPSPAPGRTIHVSDMYHPDPAIRLDPRDNVLVARRALPAGSRLPAEGIAVAEDVPRGPQAGRPRHRRWGAGAARRRRDRRGGRAPRPPGGACAPPTSRPLARRPRPPRPAASRRCGRRPAPPSGASCGPTAASARATPSASSWWATAAPPPRGRRPTGSTRSGWPTSPTWMPWCPTSTRSAAAWR